MLLHVGAQRRAQRGADALLGRWADQPTVHRGQLDGVAAGAGPDDGVVALVDGVEHAGDVGHPEPVQPDVADVRLEVQPDVRLVAADGAAAQILLGGQPLIQPLADGDLRGPGSWPSLVALRTAAG
jgi:CTP:molybdopterin cytidylyltransferase MocA